MSDKWTTKLSEFIDGELGDATRLELESHLAGCEDCRALVDELRRVIAEAGALVDRPPAGDLWRGIAARIRRGAAPVVDVETAGRRSPRRVVLSVPQLLAAGVAIAAIGVGATWLVRSPAAVRDTGSPILGPGAPSLVPIRATATDSGFESAVGELWHVVELHRSELDTATVRVIEESLAAIDRAITEARAALLADPANPYLHEHLTKTMRQKLQLLRQAAVIAAVS